MDAVCDFAALPPSSLRPTFCITTGFFASRAASSAAIFCWIFSLSPSLRFSGFGFSTVGGVWVTPVGATASCPRARPHPANVGSNIKNVTSRPGILIA